MNARGVKSEIGAQSAARAESVRRKPRVPTRVGRRCRRDGKAQGAGQSVLDRGERADSRQRHAAAARGRDGPARERARGRTSSRPTALGATPGVEIETDETDEVAGDVAPPMPRTRTPRRTRTRRKRRRKARPPRAPPPRAKRAATTSRPASWRCTSATWRSWTSCARSRSSRPRARSRRWSSISGDDPRVRAGDRLDPGRRRARGRQAAARGEDLSRGGRRSARTEVVDPGARPVRQDGHRARRPSCARSTSTASSSTPRWPRFSASAARSQGLPFEGTVPFSTSTKAFADYVKIGRAARRSASRRRRTSS